MTQDTSKALDMVETLRLVEERAAKVVKIDELVALLSHGLVNPISAALNQLHLLSVGEYGPLTHPQIDAVKRVYSEVETLSNLARVVFDLAQANRAKRRFKLTDIAVGSLIEELAAETEFLCAKTNLSFECRIQAGVTRLYTEPIRLQIVLRNLLLRAVKFSPQGKIRLEVSSENGGVAFKITDSSAGISANQVRDLFKPTEQSSSDSLGVGLFVIKQLVELVDGQIHVESESGKGTTFRVWIPSQKA